MTVYASASDKPPTLDPFDLSDVELVRFDWRAHLDSGVALATQEWSAPPGVEIGDGVKTVVVAGNTLTPAAPIFIRWDGAQWVEEASPGNADGTACTVWFTEPGRHRLENQVSFNNDSGVARSVMLPVVTTK